SRISSPATVTWRAISIRPAAPRAGPGTAASAAASAAARTSASIAREGTIVVIASPHDRDRGPQHVVRRGHGARVDLVGALAADHRDQLLDDAHVGALEESLGELAEAVLPGRAELRRAGGLGLREEVPAERAEAARVREADRLDLADLARRRLAGELDGHGTVVADRDRLRALRDRDLRRQRVAVRRHERAGRVELERAGAAVRERAVGQRDLEEPVAPDRDVEWVRGLREVALQVHPLDGGGLDPEPDLDAGRDLRRSGRERARLLERLVEEVLEVGAASLEAGRVHVREVVRDHVDVELLRLHAGRSGVERANHPLVLLTPVRCR